MFWIGFQMNGQKDMDSDGRVLPSFKKQYIILKQDQWDINISLSMNLGFKSYDFLNLSLSILLNGNLCTDQGFQIVSIGMDIC
jgi:hypothetical protein